MKKGQIYCFDHIYDGHYLNYKIFVFLGEEWVYPEGGFGIRRCKILLLGDDRPIFVDTYLLKYMKEVEELQ